MAGMRSLFLTAFLATALLPAMGCNLYFNGGGGDPCEDEWGGGGAAELPSAPLLLRNPETGVCEDFGGWGGPYPCDDACGPCDNAVPPQITPAPVPAGDEPDGESAPSFEDQADPAPQPTWGYCDSYCEGLEEGSCLATDGCRGIYAEDGNGGAGEFLECWSTDQEATDIVNCEGLDAYSCSTSDACIAVHQYACGGSSTDSDGFSEPECVPGNFVSCHSEGSQGEGCYGDQDCGSNETCNAADICLPPPGNGDGEADLAVCYGYCVPADCPPFELECPDGYEKICPPDSFCDAGCSCEPIAPGECDGDVFCESLPPKCEKGTTPGIANGCWTGECIDLSQCPDSNCGDIVGESMCIARDDCSAYYVGDDCSCDASGCTCAQWNFDSCGNNAP